MSVKSCARKSVLRGFYVEIKGTACRSPQKSLQGANRRQRKSKRTFTYRKSTDAATFPRFQWEIYSGKALSSVQILLSHCLILFLGINAPFIRSRHPFPMSPLMTFTIWGARVAVREIQFHIRLLPPALMRGWTPPIQHRTPAQRVNSPARPLPKCNVSCNFYFIWWKWIEFFGNYGGFSTLMATKNFFLDRWIRGK